MGIYHIKFVLLQEGTQRQHPGQALAADRQRFDRHPEPWGLLEDACLARTNQPDIMPALDQALCLGQDSDFLPTPAARGFRVKDPHAVPANDSACI